MVHYHWRAGGVRRVIERTLPGFASAIGTREVVLLGGEEPPADWLEWLRTAMPEGISLRIETLPDLGYVAEMTHPPAPRRITRCIAPLLAAPAGAPGAVVWMHNPGLVKNPAVPAGIIPLLDSTAARAIFHHHDFWCDNRWERYADAVTCGLGEPDALAEAIFPGHPSVVHAAINRRDFFLLRRFFGERAAWIPNGLDAPVGSAPGQTATAGARSWLESSHGIPATAPLWVLPSRVLRRKNLLEAILLRQAARKDAWVVVTGEASGGTERGYVEKLREFSSRPGNRFRLEVLSQAAPGAPSVTELQLAADALVLCSLQEGFGLAYLEAAALRRPLLCRKLRNIFPDLQDAGLSFPGAYDGLPVPNGSFDARAEHERRRAALERWMGAVPAGFRPLCKPTAETVHDLREEGAAVDFCRLSLDAQFEVIASGASPELPDSFSDALSSPAEWSVKDADILSSRQTIQKLAGCLAACGAGTRAGSAAFQRALAAAFLSPEHFFPLLHTT